MSHGINRVVTKATYLERYLEDKVSDAVTYIGRTRKPAALTSEPVWQIIRRTIKGNITEEETTQSRRFDQIWDDRYSLFPALNHTYKSIDFDAINDYVLFGDNAQYSFDYNSPFTISLWHKTAISGGEILISKKEAAGNQRGWSVNVHNTGVAEISLVSQNSGPPRKLEIRGSTLIDDGLWHHIVITHNGNGNPGAIGIWIDGSADAKTTGSNNLGNNPTINAIPMQISGREGANDLANGRMTEISIWNRDLTGAEVAELYNAGVPADARDHSAFQDCVGYYHIGFDTEYPVIHDHSAFLDDGTMTNMTEADIVQDAP